MFDRIGLPASDDEARTRFHERRMSGPSYALGRGAGAHEAHNGEPACAFSPPGRLTSSIACEPGDIASVHVVFAATTRAQVDAFHVAGQALGRGHHGVPGPAPNYGPQYPATLVSDRHGHDNAALCQAPEPH